MKKKHFNQSDANQMLIIAGCANLVTEQGYSAREVIELLEEMKAQLWSALVELEDEKNE